MPTRTDHDQRARGDAVVIDDAVGLRAPSTKSASADSLSGLTTAAACIPAPPARAAAVVLVDIGGVGQDDLALSAESAQRDAEAYR